MTEKSKKKKHKQFILFKTKIKTYLFFYIFVFYHFISDWFQAASLKQLSQFFFADFMDKNHIMTCEFELNGT